MTLELMKQKFAESKRIKHFDSWVNELFYWNDQESITKWYEEFIIFCIKNNN